MMDPFPPTAPTPPETEEDSNRRKLLADGKIEATVAVGKPSDPPFRVVTEVVLTKRQCSRRTDVSRGESSLDDFPSIARHRDNVPDEEFHALKEQFVAEASKAHRRRLAEVRKSACDARSNERKRLRKVLRLRLTVGASLLVLAAALVRLASRKVTIGPSPSSLHEVPGATPSALMTTEGALAEAGEAVGDYMQAQHEARRHSPHGPEAVEFRARIESAARRACELLAVLAETEPGEAIRLAWHLDPSVDVPDRIVAPAPECVISIYTNARTPEAEAKLVRVKEFVTEPRSAAPRAREGNEGDVE